MSVTSVNKNIVRFNNEDYQDADYFCKSTDTKPTEDVFNGARLLEATFAEGDTSVGWKIYIFDLDTETWLPFVGWETEV